ncbi:MAG TPA: serpin family protein, partial [Longimicrobiaceae bacterium]|nr:serpin family protein [Longimicrobiaceae bacterium]
FGCTDPAAPGDDPWQSIALDERIVHAYTDFGLRLFGSLAEAAPESNLFVSPTSAAFALAMTYNGAAGETREAMARTLGIAGMSREEVNRANREWLAALANTGDRRVELALANSLWGRQDFPFHNAFFERTREFYSAEVRQLPFDAAAVRAMNGWVSTQTRGKIDDIIEEIDPLAVLYLLNALYFKGEWQYRFDPAETRNEPFLVPDGRRPIVPLMRQKVMLPYLRAEGFQAVSLPYGSGRFSMVLVLPDENSSLAAFYARLTPERWNAWMDELRETEVQVFLPRFRLEWEKDLNDVLKAMGMGIAFTGAADFSEMSPTDGLLIRKVKQKTFVEVNEQGTEAAAVTVVVIGRTSGPPTLRLDRPFFYAIRDNATGTLLFLGQVVNPS